VLETLEECRADYGGMDWAIRCERTDLGRCSEGDRRMVTDKCNKCGTEFIALRFGKDMRIPSGYTGFLCGCCHDGFVTVSDPGGTRGNWTWKQLQVGLGE
jgi:hypothetical protein